METLSAQLVVLGAGPGGYAAAFAAADQGLAVTLIDRESNPGGVCLHRGCIPSKALLHVAHVIEDADAVRACGVNFSSPAIELDRLREWKRGVVAKLTAGVGQLARQRKIEYIQGDALFAGPDSLAVRRADGSEVAVRFEHCILATGSRAAVIPSLATDSARLLNSTDALDLPSIPRSLLVVGGGYIGLELGSAYAALGSNVSVVEMTPGLLPGCDRDLVNILQKRLEARFSRILLNMGVAALREEANGVRVTFRGADGKTDEELFDAVLVSVGRKPNTDNLRLEKTGVQLDDRGFVKVDAGRRSTDPRILAIGDITGNPMLAHKAAHEARVAVETLLGRTTAFAPAAIPAVIFTDPEIAWCGLTETEVAATGRTVKVTRFPWAASGRALTMGRTEGVTKLLIDPADEKLLGVAICGPGAGEMIGEAMLALEMGAKAGDLARCIHPHPTLSETLMEAAEIFFGRATHVYRPKR